MADPARARKLADRIKQVVAQMLDTRIKDPRLGFVTITDVRVTGDLQHASVFYTVLGDESDRAATAAALRSATGVIRSEVGRQTGVRLTPTLEFILDAVPETAQHLDELLRETRARDAEVAALAAQGQYAGDPDPYKVPVSDDAESDDAVSDDVVSDDVVSDDAGAATGSQGQPGSLAADPARDGGTTRDGGATVNGGRTAWDDGGTSGR